MKYLKFTIIAFVLFSMQTLHAQKVLSETPSFNFGEFAEWDWSDKNALIFADAANIRATPDAKGELLGKLTIGTKVKVLEITNVKLTQNGIESPWVKISSTSLTGYVWGGTLTKGSLKLKDGKMVLWGLIEMRKNEDEIENFFASIRIIDKGKIKMKHDFEVVHATNPKYGFLEVFPAPKLDSVQNLIVFNTVSEACGVYASMHYLLYTGTELNFVGSGYSMGDGGVLSTSLIYVFPQETEIENYRYNPQAKHIFQIENNGTYEEDCSWIETTKVLDFIWEGNQLIKYCEE